MRPKSPFLQNLRKKTPQPQMKQRGGAVPTTAVPKAAERGFQPFQWEQGCFFNLRSLFRNLCHSA